MDSNANNMSLIKINSINLELLFQYLNINDLKEISEKLQNKKLYRIYNKTYLR